MELLVVSILGRLTIATKTDRESLRGGDVLPTSRTSNRNDRESSLVIGETSPVIGILTQPLGNQSTSEFYIAASYVKWLEAGGARSIPIPYDATNHSLLDDLFEQIHALFLPGGASALPYSVNYLLHKSWISNERQRIYFPVWGTCLGFEFLLEHFGKPGLFNVSESVVQDGFDAENVTWPLLNVVQQQLYHDPALFDIVTHQNVTLNNHHQGMTPDRFLQNPYLSSKWKITSTNHDLQGRMFISTIEPIYPDYLPFYGVQYHPEKNAFEYATYPGTDIPYEAINHSDAAVAFSNAMARFVVQLARQTIHWQEMRQHKRQLASRARDNQTIWDAPQAHAYTKPDLYPTVITYPQRTGLKFEQIYILPPARHFETASRDDAFVDE